MESLSQVSRLLAVDFPIIQAPMLGVSTPQMTAAASNTGALGSLALGDLPYEQCITLIQQTQGLTQKPFAANIFLHQLPKVTPGLVAQYEQTKSFLKTLAQDYNLSIEFPDFESLQPVDYRDQLKAVAEAGVPALSFTFGNLDADSIQYLKQHKITLIGTASSVAEALALETSGIDIICVQGIEAGGHRGSFTDRHIPQIGGMTLLMQVSEAVKIPIVYAGGLYNATTIQAARILGAGGFQLGSIFLCEKESALKAFEKQRLQKLREEEIVLTKSFSGRYARGIENEFIRKVEQSGTILPYPYQNKITAALRKAAREQQNAELVNLWTGQAVHPFSEDSTAAILQELIRALQWK